MSDERVPDPDWNDLPELPDFDEIPELPEEIPELPDEAIVRTKSAPSPPPVRAAAPVRAASKPRPKADRPKPSPIEEVPAPIDEVAPQAPPRALTDGETPPLRELDRAPAHLRKAAVIAALGCLLPWMGHGGGLMTSVAAKLVTLAGVGLWYLQVKHNWGPPLSGLAGKLGSLCLKPEPKEEDAKNKRKARGAQQAAKTIQHPFPTALHVGSLLLMVLGCVLLPVMDKTEGFNPGIGMAEIGMLAWAAFTWVHIYAYERWGSFNPIFPLMFLAMVLGGAARMVFGFGEGLDNFTGIASVAGGGIVAVGGVLAAWTIVEAMMQAKKEGDIKKQAAIEARKAARKARR